MAHDLAAAEAAGGAPRAGSAPVVRSRVWVLGLVALAVFLDGFDNRLFPLSLPALLRTLDIPRGAFALTASAGILGVAGGTALGGMLGDRWGRRPTMLTSAALFGLMTAINGLAGDWVGFTACRLLASVGIGALLPSAAAMLAEFAPPNRRVMTVAIGMTGMPLGGAAAGLAGAAILPAFGWRSLFFAGGALALIVTLSLFLLLPESPALIQRRTLRRSGAHSAAPSFLWGDIRSLFSPLLRRDTLGLWMALFAALTCVYLESQWLPTVLSDAGYGLSVTSTAAACLSVGSIAACILGVAAMQRFGSRRALIAMTAAGAALMLALTRYPMDPRGSVVPLFALMLLAGCLIGGLQVMLYSLAAHIYPTVSRATGIGWAAGVGRLGSLSSPLLAAAAFASYGPRSLFVLMAVSLALTMIGLIWIRQHVPVNGHAEDRDG